MHAAGAAQDRFKQSILRTDIKPPIGLDDNRAAGASDPGIDNRKQYDWRREPHRVSRQQIGGRFGVSGGQIDKQVYDRHSRRLSCQHGLDLAGIGPGETEIGEQRDHRLVSFALTLSRAKPANGQLLFSYDLDFAANRAVRLSSGQSRVGLGSIFARTDYGFLLANSDRHIRQRWFLLKLLGDCVSCRCRSCLFWGNAMRKILTAAAVCLAASLQVAVAADGGCYSATDQEAEQAIVFQT